MKKRIRMRATRAAGQQVWRVEQHEVTRDAQGNVISEQTKVPGERFDSPEEALAWIATQRAAMEDGGEATEWEEVYRDA